MMPGLFICIVGALGLSSLKLYNCTCQSQYYRFPKFWTNIGLCPPGKIIHDNIKDSLFSDAMQRNLLYISALPRGAVTHIRIHWLLELLHFQQFTQSGVPVYDFSILDKFVMDLDQKNLYPVFEFMANLSNVFLKNPTRNNFYWENLSYQVTKHYLNYLTYIQSLHVGLKIAGSRPVDSLHFLLRGPSGLFKSLPNHTLCWSILDYCNEYLESCPIDVLTYHRKGSGENSSIVLNNSKMLLKKIYEKYPNIKKLKFSNEHSDPVSGWSTPRSFLADVRYATTVVNIILEHWNAKLTDSMFENLETISFDNAFLSYHPHEFSQGTLLAHFRMNKTEPPHSQFVQKPIYAAMGLMSRLADMSSDVITIETTNHKLLYILKTIDSEKLHLYSSWLIMSNSIALHDEMGYITLPKFELCDNKSHAFIIENIDQDHTNPANVWFKFNSPPYPNATVREAMRRQQGPRILKTGHLNDSTLTVDYRKLKAPWVILLRICSSLKPRLKIPYNLLITSITHNEVLITWKEVDAASVHCLKNYEVWFRVTSTHTWINISSDWHTPFPSFHFAPLNGLNVNGFYKVRGIDIFNNTSLFSTEVQYIEI